MSVVGGWRPLRSTLVAAMATAVLLGATVLPVAAATVLTSVSAGADHSCATASDSGAYCWGADGDGEVGFGSTTSGRDPKQVQDASGDMAFVAAVSAGRTHSCALKTDGTVWCWGAADFGQVGDGTTGDGNHDRLVPAQVRKGAGNLTKVTAIAAGGYHTCALRSDRSVWCWGDATFGAVGDGTTGDASTHLRLTAVRVKQGSGFLADITRISAGWAHTCARRADGTAWCWGYTAHGEVGDGTTGGPVSHVRLKAVQVRRGSHALSGVEDIEAGEDHTCAVRSDSTAWCWGHADKGQIGDGTTGNGSKVRLKAVQVRRGGGFLTNITSISAGEDRSCARRSDGTAWCWGYAEFGAVGDGTTGDPVSHLRLTAVKVQTATGPLAKVKAVTAGASHTCAFLADGTAWCWGLNQLRQLGIRRADGDVHPYAVQFGVGVVIIP